MNFTQLTEKAKAETSLISNQRVIWSEKDSEYNASTASCWKVLERAAKTNQLLLVKILYSQEDLSTRIMKIEGDLEALRDSVNEMSKKDNAAELMRKVQEIKIQGESSSSRKATSPTFGLIRKPGVSWKQPEPKKKTS